MPSIALEMPRMWLVVFFPSQAVVQCNCESEQYKEAMAHGAGKTETRQKRGDLKDGAQHWVMRDYGPPS